MFKKQLNKNIAELDNQIAKLGEELRDETVPVKRKGLISEMKELIELRDMMSENKVNESLTKEIIGGVLSVGSLVLVLRYEKAEIITSKAFSMIKGIKGSK